MRAILNKEAREEFLSTNWKFSTMAFKWSRSGVCRLYDRRDDQTKFYAGGYGYDKKGTVLGDFINTFFSEELKKLDSSKFYGLSHYNRNAKSNKRRFLKYASKNTCSYVDGGCGFNCMVDILFKIGFKMPFVQETKNSSIYTLTTKN